MKKMKKVLAMLIAMVMVLGMSVTTFATTSSTPTSPLTPATMKPSTTAISGNPTSADKVDWRDNWSPYYNIISDCICRIW